MKLYETLRALEAIENECFLTMTISYECPKETVGTVLPLFEDQDIDIMGFLRDKIPHILITEVHADIDGDLVEILDNSGFVWACVMHLRSGSRRWINLPIYINGCPLHENMERFTKSEFCGYREICPEE